MSKADIVLEINYDINEPDKTTTRTNAKKEAVEEILAAWISYQMGEGKDESEPNRKDIYHITIKLDLSDDTFSTRSDTGNKGLTCGIVMDVFGRLDNLEILALV